MSSGGGPKTRTMGILPFSQKKMVFFIQNYYTDAYFRAIHDASSYLFTAE